MSLVLIDTIIKNSGVFRSFFLLACHSFSVFIFQSFQGLFFCLHSFLRTSLFPDNAIPEKDFSILLSC